MTDHTRLDEAELEQFPPTLREVMLRPKWIGLLMLCLVVAGVFSWLLQWQLSRALAPSPVEFGATENIEPLDDIVQPGGYLDGPYVGQKVETEGNWDPDNFLVVSQRSNEGEVGYWVTGRFIVDGASLATAIGWAPDLDTAEHAISVLEDAATGEKLSLTGRIISSEDPAVPPADNITEIGAMSTADLLNHWESDGETYRPFLVSDDKTGGITDAGLEEISSPAPAPESSLNLLNLFYAVEWAIFAGFSFYLWYRLAKDAWEREIEELAGGDPDEDDD